MEDQYEKRKNAKKERIAKNEYQRLRNVAKNTKRGGKSSSQTYKYFLSFFLYDYGQGIKCVLHNYRVVID